MPLPVPQGIALPMPAADSDLRRGLPRQLALLTIAYMLVLLFATNYPKPEEFLGTNPPSDKTLHFIAYGLLGLLAGSTLAAMRRCTLRSVLIAAVALAVFAAIDEATQPWFRRHADPADWVYDMLGLLVGLAIVAGVRWTTRRGG